jgi:hypothetical protein
MNRGQLVLEIDRLNKQGVKLIHVGTSDGEIVKPIDVLKALED